MRDRLDRTNRVDRFFFGLGVRLRRLREKVRRSPPPETTESDWLGGIDKMRISPRFTVEKLATGRIEDWIDVYEDRVRGWLLSHAWALGDRPNSNFAMFQLALSYFEAWAQYRWGEDSTGRSQEFFGRALVDVFPHPRDRDPKHEREVMKLFYRAARCGALHDNHPGRGIFFHRGLPSSMMILGGHESGRPIGIVINPRRFVADVGGHRERYVAALRDPANVELRDNFSKTWRRLHR